MDWKLTVPPRGRRRLGANRLMAGALLVGLGGLVGLACAPGTAVRSGAAPAPEGPPAASPLVGIAQASMLAAPGTAAITAPDIERELRESVVPAPEPAAEALPIAERLEMTSTAYCLRGNMRTGVRTRDGMAAGDPAVLPLGSVVRVTHPDGRPVGLFVIMDTGGAIKGNKIDIYMDSCAEARRWGRRPVVAEVVAIGRA